MSDVNFENALITRIIEDKAIKDVIGEKITVDFFYGTSERAAFIWLLDWYKNPDVGDTPSWDMFSDTFPNFEAEVLEDSPKALCTKVREQKLYSDIAEAITHVGEVTGGDAFEGLEEMKRLTARLSSLHTVDLAVDVRDRVDELKREYMLMKTGKTGLKGKPYPWEALNNATLGCQDSHVVIIYGRPKSYKTWCALATMRGFHRAGSRILVCSQELGDLEMSRRVVALDTEVDYRQFLRGKLPENVEKDFMDNLDAFVESEAYTIDNLICMGADIDLELCQKIDETGCDSVLIDGVHTLGHDWKELKAVTQTLKRVAKKKKVRIVCTTHANKTGIKAEVGGAANDMAHSDSFFQDCDLALRIQCDIENRRAQEVIAWTAAIRDGDTCAFAINMKLSQDLTQKRAVNIGGDEEMPDPAAMDDESDERE